MAVKVDQCEPVVTGIYFKLIELICIQLLDMKYLRGVGYVLCRRGYRVVTVKHVTGCPQYAGDRHVIPSLHFVRHSPHPYQLYTLTSHSSLIHCQRARSLPSLSFTLQTFSSGSSFGPEVTQCELLTICLRRLPG